MCGAASVLMRRGAIVTGSDQIESQAVQHLSAAGATIYVGHEHENISAGVDFVVASAAIKNDNPEFLAARSRAIPILKYSELLGLVMQSRLGVAIAGTHGKSTTTAMAAFAAREAGLDPSFIIGAEVPQLGGGSGVGDGPSVLVEACEFDRSFLNLTPTCGVILNIEEDHLDYFQDLDDIIDAFSQFAGMISKDGILFHNHDDPVVRQAITTATCRLESFGLHPSADWQAKDLTYQGGLASFEIMRQGQSLGRAILALPGRHNIYNALAAIAVTHHLGGDVPFLLEALSQFKGVERRFAHRGKFRGVDILDDYAHHPTEVKATLQAITDHYEPRRLIVVFQPHQVSRTRFFLEDFAGSFELADIVVLPDIYFVRDSEEDRQLVSSNDLVRRINRSGGDAVYVPTLEEIAIHLAGIVRDGDMLVTMGAGDVWKVADEMVSRLASDRP